MSGMDYEYVRVGITEIDADHARLIAHLEKLETAHASGHARAVTRLLRSFLTAFDQHFDMESRILRDQGFRDLDRRHSEFLTSRSWIMSHPLDVRDAEQVGRIIEFVRAWLFDHITRQDGAIAEQQMRRDPRRRFLRSLRLALIPLRWRLVLIGAIPLAIMLALTSMFLSGLVDKWRTAAWLQHVVRVDESLGDLVQELQEEGNKAILVVGSPHQDRSYLDAQIVRTNEKIKAFHDAAAAMRSEVPDPAVVEVLGNAEDSLALIGRSRSDVQTGSYDVFSTIEYYETIVSDLMAVVPAVNRTLDGSVVTRSVNSYGFLLKAAERAGAERLLGTSLLAGVKVNVTTHDPRFITQFATEQETLGRTFMSLADNRSATLFEEAMATSPMLDSMRDAIVRSADLPSPESWSRTTALRLERMRAVERNVAADIIAQAAALQLQANQHVTVVGGSVLLALFLSLAFLSLLGLSVVPPLKRLGLALRRLANGERLVALPDIRDRDDIGGLARDIAALRERLIQGDLLEARRGTETADRLRTTLDSLPGIVFRVAQMEGAPVRVVGVSRKFYQLLGLRDQDVVDRSLGSVLRACVEPGDRLSLMHMLRRMEGGSLDFECRLLRKPGQPTIWVRILATPVHTNNGRLWDGVALDVTDAKHAEIERRRLQDEFDRLRLSQTTKRMAAGIGNELAQLWGPLRANAEEFIRSLPEGSPLHAKAREVHAIALRTERLAAQLDRTLDQSRAVQPIAVVDELAAAFSALPASGLGDASLECSFGGRSARVSHDPEAIGHMISHLMNHVSEIVRAEGGLVSITTAVREFHAREHLSITITDEHVAAPGTLSKVLQLNTMRKGANRGEGLSLAIVRVVVDGAQGFMQSQVTPTGGNVLEILLPVMTDRPNNVIRLERSAKWPK